MHAVRGLRRAGVGVEAVEPVTVARSGDRTRTALSVCPPRCTPSRCSQPPCGMEGGATRNVPLPHLLQLCPTTDNDPGTVRRGTYLRSSRNCTPTPSKLHLTRRPRAVLARIECSSANIGWLYKPKCATRAVLLYCTHTRGTE